MGLLRMLGLVACVVACATGPGASAVASASPPPGPDPSPGAPAVSTKARAAGFVDVRSVVPGAIVDLRYANNFVGMPLYPPDARCLVHESLAPGPILDLPVS